MTYLSICHKEKAKTNIKIIADERIRGTDHEVTNHFSRNYFFAVVRTPQWEVFTSFKMTFQFLQLKQNNVRLVNYLRKVRYHFKRTVEQLSMWLILLLL